MRQVVNGKIKNYSLFLDSDCGNNLTLNLELQVGKSQACCFSINVDELQDIGFRAIRKLFAYLDITKIYDLKGLPVIIVIDNGLVVGVGNFLNDLCGPFDYEHDFFIPRDMFDEAKNN